MFKIKTGVTKDTQENPQAQTPLAVRTMMASHIMEPLVNFAHERMRIKKTNNILVLGKEF